MIARMLSRAIFLYTLFLPGIRSFFLAREKQSLAARCPGSRTAAFVKANEDKEEEFFVISSEDQHRDISDEELAAKSPLGSLEPPMISFRRRSLLFEESTQEDDVVLSAWRQARNALPPIVSGAWPWRPRDLADDNPLGALYNLAFVRLPVIGLGVYYARFVLAGHNFIVDLGNGPFLVNPMVVFLLLGFVLL